jgi:hypothetical protein
MKTVFNVKTKTSEIVELTKEENEARIAEEQAWDDGASAREMKKIRNQRNNLLSETDWMALPDVTMSNAWKTYRQELRDIPANNTIYKDVTWPTKPE